MVGLLRLSLAARSYIRLSLIVYQSEQTVMRYIWLSHFNIYGAYFQQF
jgi:hypothetical protein